MTDYAEEQENELLALESMYPDELTILHPHPTANYKISLVSQAILRSEEEPIKFDLVVKYTEKYPDEMPILEIANDENLSEDRIKELLTVCEEQGNCNLGMPFVFPIISALQDRIEEIVERINEIEILEEEKETREREEAAEKILVGTPVTIETFLKWKEKFDAELYEKRRIEEMEKERLSTKQTGIKKSFVIYPIHIILSLIFY
ncbi:DgyrCDS2497 [Dimorphilus gyrociliatus]|uniref:DgyrCDS2497 n=1 Tax=Dimorphilus gyrociliatus TaxID=2664684 RepID=A0A7I8VAH5_9ANNE|nr:DgyrCDS2497 [Dimorphilus gyrociliatus]